MLASMSVGVLVVSLAVGAHSAPDYPPQPFRSADALPTDMATVRGRWLDMNTLRTADPALSATQEAVEGIDRAATRLLQTQIRDPAGPDFGSWGDVTGLKDDAISYHGGYHGKPATLAAAYACPHAKLYRSPEVLAAIDAALSYGARYYHVDMERPGNWWAWDIGSTMRIGDALLLAGQDIDPALREGYLRAMYFEGERPVSLGFDKPGTGANAIWIAYNAMRLALLTGDEPLMRRAAAIFADIAQVGGPKGDGIMPDGSFHQHGNGINMGYGGAMLADVTEYMLYTADTAYALPAASLDAMVRFFGDYVVWDAYRGKFNPYSQGRAATRPGAFRYSGAAVAAVRFLAAGIQAAYPAAPSTLADYAGGDVGAVLALQPSLAPALQPHLAALAQAKPLLGVRALPYSDMIVSRSADHFLSVRLAADTKGWFSIANENLRAHQVGEGSVVLLTDGKELEQDTAINRPWDALMGVSFVPGLQRPRETESQSSLVGCASAGTAGLIAADYVLSDEEHSLTGKKAYLLLANLLVMLGADLRSSAAEPVATTLYSIPLRDDNEAMLNGSAVLAASVDAPMQPGGALWYRNTGLLLLEGQGHALAQTISTPYATVNARNNDGKTYENTYLRVTTAGPDSTYAALVAAGVPQGAFAGMAQASPVEVAANNPDIQGALRTDRAAGAVAVYTSGSCAAGGLSARGALVWETVGDQVHIVVSRRNVEAETVTVSVPLALRGPSVGTVVSVGEGQDGTAVTHLELSLPGGYIVEQAITAGIARP